MPIIILGLIALLQITAYNVLGRRKVKFYRLIVLTVVLIVYLLIIPVVGGYYLSENLPEDACGTAYAALYFVSWFLGGGLTIFLHVAHWFISKMNKLSSSIGDVEEKEDVN